MVRREFRIRFVPRVVGWTSLDSNLSKISIRIIIVVIIVVVVVVSNE